MRIKLAHWYGEHAPGDELDVDEPTVKALRRDGLVAEVVDYQGGDTLQPGVMEATNDSGTPEVVEPTPESGRRKR